MAVIGGLVFQVVPQVSPSWWCIWLNSVRITNASDMMVKEGEFRNTGVRLISFYWKQMSASGLQGLSHLFSLHPLLCTAGVS